ncbi:hypothetical protein E2562_015726 [Oryza meyeriana var. granulata]|uniref:Uncharacterized protein n=1 Tax=Oryza meyeriana var. granulata TaxID=110450 RepID=A0A6G1D4B5_9ORYZ|nr:hypothetical protein E2562_015726 [Oryza meyeriana var. granulata]
MLHEGRNLRPGHRNLGRYVRFLNLCTGALVRVHLFLFDDHTLLDSADGLLLLRRSNDTAIRLLHQFTGDIADLPPFSSLLPQIEPHIRHLWSVQDPRNSERMAENHNRCFLTNPSVCSAITVSPAGAITVMLDLPLNLGNTLIHVAHTTAGDQQWTLSGWKLQPFGSIHRIFPRQTVHCGGSGGELC